MTPTFLRNVNISSHRFGRTAAAVSLAIVFALAIVATPAAQAQTYTVIHNFTGGADGSNPRAGLTSDAAGNLYGTASQGGNSSGDFCRSVGGCGTVFKLKHSGSGWVLSPLYGFAGGADGSYSQGRVAIARDGSLYGTTWLGGEGSCFSSGSGCGVVFHLTPPATVPAAALSPWNESVLYRFTGGSDGGLPEGDLTLDPSGNIYGTTENGGLGIGVVYELTPSGSGWTENVIHAFDDYNGDGGDPQGGVIFDHFGNLYGVFFLGGFNGAGGVYQLSPSGSSWTAQFLYGFTGGSDGANPMGG